MLYYRLTYIYLGLIFITFAQAQEVGHYPHTDHPELFKAIPMIDHTTPQWARMMYNYPLRFAQIVEARSIYNAKHRFRKNIHTQNYKYWYRQVKEYVNDEGQVDFPQSGTEFRKYKALYKKERLQKSAPIWHNIGPERTYRSDGSLATRPTQANVYCLAVAPSNTSVLYAGMETGGIFKSIDKGLNWVPVTYDYAIRKIYDIKVDPWNPDIVYATRDRELYKTTDGGLTWSLIYTSTGRMEQLYIHTVYSDTIYAATSTGLIKSMDGGLTWSTKYTGRLYDIEAKPGTNDTLYIAVENTILKRPEIWKSTNAGDIWTLMDNGYYVPSDTTVATVYGCKIGVTPADPNRIYAGIIASGKAGDNGWIGIYYSLDEGGNWQEDSGFDGGPYESGNADSTNWYVAGYASGYHQGFYNFDIDVSHNDPDRLWIGTIWFCESGNRGGNIEYIRGTRSLEMHADIQDIDVVGDEIWIASDGGINYSNDECQTVEVRMKGITASDFWGFDQGWNTDTWVGGRYHNGDAVFHENYGFRQTVFLGGAERATGYVNPFDNRKMYMSDIRDKRISNTLNVASENISNLAMYPNESYLDFQSSNIAWSHKYAQQLLIGKDSSIYRSDDGGNSFYNLYSFPGSIRRLAISRADDNVICAIVFVSYWDWRMYRSIDGGESFAQLSKPVLSGGSWRNLSFALNPFDKNEIWLASNSSSDGNKIFRSIDGGVSWMNQYDNILSGQKIKDMLFQASPQGDVLYIMTNDNFYYYDINVNQWTNYRSGLPVLHGGFIIKPFYRDNKIRMASSKGIWEAPMIRVSRIQAKPMIASDTVYCYRDTVRMDSYSISSGTTTYRWDVEPSPQWMSSINIRNPKMVLGANGDYTIRLIVEDVPTGQIDTTTISSMLVVDTQCEAETIQGQALKTYNHGDYLIVNDANLHNITHFTITGWWKPDSALTAFGALVSSGDWCAHCDYTEGLIVDYWGSKLWYKWPGNAGQWGRNSGMSIPMNEWSYVALVIEPDRATLYLNEEMYVHNITLNPGNISNLYIGYGHYNKSFRGEIDEVTLWNRALTYDEIKALRHITKEQQIKADSTLIGYFQFNTLYGGSRVMDHGGVLHGVLYKNAALVPSNVPVGGGESETFSVFSGGNYNSQKTGVEMVFDEMGTYPNGDVVISRINLKPNITPSNGVLSDAYWIINNYGNNKTFTALSSISFSDLGNVSNHTPASEYHLSGRNQNDHRDSWVLVSQGDSIEANDERIVFETAGSIDSSGQFVISNQGAIGWIGVISSDWDNPANWSTNSIPNAQSDVIITAGTPFYPIVNVDVMIRSLTLMEQAEMHISPAIRFDVSN